MLLQNSIEYSFSEQIANLAESKWPNLFTTNIRKSERKDRIFIDYLRNSKSSTCVAPFSLRARDGATISMPIKWSDLNMRTGNLNISRQVYTVNGELIVDTPKTRASIRMSLLNR